MSNSTYCDDQYEQPELVRTIERLKKENDELKEKISAISKNHQEPVSEDLEEAIDTYLATYWGGEKEKQDWPFLKKMAIHFANWQKEQFEKNRLKHCDSITNEQAELEQGFIDQHLDKHQRMPTFLDAIEYGMKLMKEQLMKDAMEAEVTHCKSLVIPSLGWMLDKNGLDFGDKVKLIIIKEE